MVSTNVTRLIRIPLFLLVLTGSYAAAQTETLMYDHIHMVVPNPQVAAQWYQDNIGGEFVDGRDDRLLFGTTRIMWIPDRGNTRKPSAGSVVDHLGFSFTDLQATLNKIEVAGATLEGEIRDVPGLFKLGFAVDPWGTRLELVEEPQHLGLHHIHLRAPDPVEALAWYKETFGGVSKNMKGRLPGLLYPGNVWLLVSRGETFPSTEGTIDHIGWRAPEVASTMASLQGKGVEVTRQPREMELPNGMIEFFYVAGPNGANVELVQRAPDMP
ncbi:MAG: VOC family protein [Gammaproteobacteria bacterium]|nr:VOC family protein [Gammaproteobacteria bacterium]